VTHIETNILIALLGQPWMPWTSHWMPPQRPEKMGGLGDVSP